MLFLVLYLYNKHSNCVRSRFYFNYSVLIYCKYHSSTSSDYSCGMFKLLHTLAYNDWIISGGDKRQNKTLYSIYIIFWLYDSEPSVQNFYSNILCSYWVYLEFVYVSFCFTYCLCCCWLILHPENTQKFYMLSSSY